MQTLNVKIINVSEVTTETGEKATVNLGLVYNTNANAMTPSSIGLDITGDTDAIAYYKANAGSIMKLPIDITTVTLVKPQ